jgi:hypothetical protein
MRSRRYPLVDVLGCYGTPPPQMSPSVIVSAFVSSLVFVRLRADTGVRQSVRQFVRQLLTVRLLGVIRPGDADAELASRAARRIGDYLTAHPGTDPVRIRGELAGHDTPRRPAGRSGHIRADPRLASAMLAGAKLEAVAGALGNSLDEAYRRWHEWAARQRDFIIAGEPGITEEEYDVVAQRFAGLGIKLADRTIT